MDSSISAFDRIHCCKNWGFQSEINNRIANSIDPDDMAHYELSHLDLHCLQRYMKWSAGLKDKVKFIADDSLKFFSEKTSLDISCESSAKQMIHMKCQDLFFF